MAKLIRAWALTLCMLMLLLPSLAMAAATSAGQNDIIDEDAEPSPSYADQLAQTEDAGAATAGDQGNAGGSNSTNSGAPSFRAVDTTQPLTQDGTTGAHQAVDITRNCKYKLSEGKAGVFGDSKLSTYWANKKKAKIQITIPANDTAGGLYLEWVKKPSDFQIVEYDATNNELQSRDATSYTALVSVVPLLAETKKIELVFNAKVGISTMRVFSQGDLPSAVQNWRAPLEKADLMVVAAHQDDEFLYFGGTIPYYNTVEGKAVQVVYMANCGRGRYAEALNGLWSVGMRNAPDFIGFKDQYTKTLKEAKKYWKTDTVMEQLVARIRKYKPDVIVSHDVKGEYGHGAHMLTAEALKLAVEQAADDTKFKSSADAYGVWQVQKLYLHLYAENQITMDWKQPADALSGKTPSEAAKVGYQAHKSQQKSFTYEEGGKYDNSLFGLAFTTVGEDVEKNDFFENIDESAAKLNLGDGAGTDDPILDESGLPDDGFFMGEDAELGEEGDLSPVDDSELSPDDTDPDLTGSGDVTGGTGDEGAVVTPPAEPSAPGNTGGLLAVLIGAPVLMGGSAFGVVAGRKYLKKRHRAARRADKQQEA